MSGSTRNQYEKMSLTYSVTARGFSRSHASMSGISCRDRGGDGRAKKSEGEDVEARNARARPKRNTERGVQDSARERAGETPLGKGGL